ncbi:hypothetical protein [Streptomyces sp. NPDC057403]|uniref:hypothetical protein n=1 Tax=Streptomyces sp. NPDC057403 TaxID=3346119 RepID=UPI0036A4729E
MKLDFIVDARDLSHTLQLFWEKKGAPPSRVIIQQSKDEIVIPRSSLQRILRRQAFVQSERQLMAIARGCFATKLEEKKWEAAWEKVHRRR